MLALEVVALVGSAVLFLFARGPGSFRGQPACLGLSLVPGVGALTAPAEGALEAADGI